MVWFEVLGGSAQPVSHRHVLPSTGPSPRPWREGILNGPCPTAFLDDAPLEERRTQAVYARRTLDNETADQLGALDPAAIERVREEAWPDPRDAEEVHEALTWMGFVTREEGAPWAAWLAELEGAGRVQLEGERWFALDATRDPKAVLRGRMEALGPIHDDDPLLFELESDGVVMRVRFGERQGWCDRRLLARIRRYTLDRLRREIEPVSAAEFLRFLGAWQHVDEEYRLEGPAGVAVALRQLAGFEAPVASWERKLLGARVRDYRPEWLDQLAFGGEVAWGRFWGSGRSALRSTPVCFVPREDLTGWLGLTQRPELEGISWQARAMYEELERCGATFQTELVQGTKMLPSDAERGLEELVAMGLATGDSFRSLRQLLRPAYRRKEPAIGAGRWSLFRTETHDAPQPEFIARRLLARYGVLFRSVMLRERQPIPWRDLVRSLRTLELRGEIRGGRFVAGFSGEQFALPEAIPLMRSIRRRGEHPALTVAAADPLNLLGVLTPDERVPSTALRSVTLVEAGGSPAKNP